MDDDKIELLVKEILKFQDERDWEQFHTPKNLATGIAVEAGELLEHFQWVDYANKDEINPKDMQKIKDEIADVLTYILLLANNLDINIFDAVREKMKKNGEKYPIHKAKGSRKKYTEF